ncbi:tetratricopeptide repeat protein 28 isoform X3 [Hydra vulgaris]|nr:tetratricopeptide repeat protein 28 isoform X3 [Hydra vulgaris]XP_047142485.1 tetratricopeptide repeat protein 28 isoform X3 [Hydra vulgaris]
MGRYTESLASYASALAHDCKSSQLLKALIDAALRSPLQEILEPLFKQIESIDKNEKAFAVVALIGQEIISSMDILSAIVVLESALHIGTEDLHLKASVYSALSSSYWNIDNIKNGLHYMHQELLIYETLNDLTGMCRVNGNLGSAYYALEQYHEAKQHYYIQFEMSQTLQDHHVSCAALTSLGRVLIALKDYAGSIDCHKKCASLFKKMNLHLEEIGELSNVANIYSFLGEFLTAEHFLLECLKVSQVLKQIEEKCKVLNRLGTLYQNMHNIDEAVKVFQEMLQISQDAKNYDLVCQSLSYLGHTYRIQKNLKLAESIHKLQLQKAEELGSFILESRALTDLGVTYFHMSKFELALKSHKAHLKLCEKFNDKEGKVKAYGNIGNVYQMIQEYEKAIKYHKMGITCALELNDRYSEASLHGNLGVAYQSLNMMNEAKEHYEIHLTIAKEMNYLRSECVAESNLGNFSSVLGRLHEALPHYENHLLLAKKLNDKLEVCKAMQNLAHIYYRLNRYNESIKCYEESLSLANELDANELIGLAYYNLGLVYLADNDFEKAVRCQKLLLASAQEKKNVFSICKAYGNLGLIYMKMGKHSDAKDYFKEQICAAEKSSIETLKCDCYRDFAVALASEKLYKDACEQYEKEIALRRKLNNEKLFESILSFASFLETIKDFDYAYKCYSELFQATKLQKDLKNCKKVCHLLGNLSIKMKKFKKAISSFILELKCTEIYRVEITDIINIHRLLSECYDNLNDFENAAYYLLECQAIAVFMKNYSIENEINKCLRQLCEKYNDYKSALMYSEKRLISCQELTDFDKCDAYKDIAASHLLLKNYDSSFFYYNQLLSLAKEFNILQFEYDAYTGLGLAYAQVLNFMESLKYYLCAVECSEKLSKPFIKAECLVNIGDCYQYSSDNQHALEYYKKALEICHKNDFKTIKVTIFGRIGKTFHLLGNSKKAISYLCMAVSVCEQLQDPAEFIKCFYRLGLKFFFENDNESSSKCFQKVIDFIEENELKTDLLLKERNFIKASYEMLQKVYVTKKEYLQAMFVAEKGNIFNRKLLISKSGIKICINIPLFSKFVYSLKTVTHTTCLYSIVIGKLYCWIIKPNEGFVKFWEKSVDETNLDSTFFLSDLDNFVTCISGKTLKTLNDLVFSARRSFNVEGDLCIHSKFDNSLPNNELLDNKDNQNKPNEFAKSKLEDFDVDCQLKTANYCLYLLFFSQVVSFLDAFEKTYTEKYDMILVLPCEITLVPFYVFEDDSKRSFLYEHFNFFFSTDMFSLLENSNNKVIPLSQEENFIIFGEKVCNNETRNINKVLKHSTLITSNSSKEEILQQISSSTISHIALNVMWHTPGICFPYIDNIVEHNCIDLQILDLDDNRPVSTPNIIISVKDIICKTKFHSKLIVFGVNIFNDSICVDGMQSLVSSFLINGCETILTSQWPISKGACSYFFSKFYEQFSQRVPVYNAFNNAIKEMQASNDYNSPSNWAGLVIYGKNCQLTKKACNFTKAFNKFLEVPNRDSLKIILHLVETAQKRLAQDLRTSLYITEESIQAKLLPTNVNWKPILVSLGFRFEKAHDNIPDAVFFPEYEYTNLLAKASKALYGFLGLNKNGLLAISRLRSSPTAVLHLQKIVSFLQDVIHYFNQEMSDVQVSFPSHLWRLPGCHEFLSSLDFDLVGVEKTEVKLQSGKKEGKKTLQCAVQSLNNLLDNNEDDTLISQTQNLNNSVRKSSLSSELDCFNGVNGGNTKRLKVKTSIDGFEKRFSQIDVSDMTLCEQEVEHWQKTFYFDNEDITDIEPDIIEQEDIDAFIDNFKKSDLVNDALCNSDTCEKKTNSFRKKSFFSRNYLISSSKTMDRVNSIKTMDRVNSIKTMDRVNSIKTMDRINSIKTMDRINSIKTIDRIDNIKDEQEKAAQKSKEEFIKCTKQKKPPDEWRRLRLDSDYFNNNANIKTINVRDSFCVHRGFYCRRISDFSTSSRNSYDSSLSAKSHNEEGLRKKKNLFNLIKKAKSIGNIADEPDNSHHTYDSEEKVTKKLNKVKKKKTLFTLNILSNNDQLNNNNKSNTLHKFEEDNSLYTNEKNKKKQSWFEISMK